VTSFKDSHSPGYRPAVASDFPGGQYVPGYFVKLETTPAEEGATPNKPKQTRVVRSPEANARRNAKRRAKQEAKYAEKDE
jgi:hypothetical protein